MIRHYLLLLLAPCAPLLAKAEMDVSAKVALEESAQSLREAKPERPSGLVKFTRRAFESMARALDAIWQTDQFAPATQPSVELDFAMAAVDPIDFAVTTSAPRRILGCRLPRRIDATIGSPCGHYLQTQRLLL